MLTFNMDLGQIIISFLLAISTFFGKRTLEGISQRLDKHDDMLIELSGNVHQISGLLGSGNAVGRNKNV